jgi:NodT family efflux transporter outer membrane factor (OMF) lipoprotein
MKYYFLPFVLMSVLLSSCAVVGPDYQQPDIEWLQQWQPTAYAYHSKQKNTDSLDIQFWWEIFNDPLLNRLIEKAKQQNYSLKIAGLKVFESRALLAIASSTIYPQLQQLDGGVNYINNQLHGGKAANKSQSFVNTQTGINIGWELDFWGRFQRAIESADAAFFASISNQHDVQVLLAAQVASAYFSYRTTQSRIIIAHKNAAIQKRSLEITTNLYESGQDSELDLQQAKTQYLAILSTIPSLEISLNQARNALTTLLAMAPTTIENLHIDMSDYHWPDISVDHFKYIPANLLTRRPDIRTAAWRVAAQSAQIGYAKADLYPAISLFGTIGWSGTSLNGSPDTTGLLLGPSFTWNFLDYDRIENNVRIQDSRLQQLIEQYQSSVIQAAKEVDDASYSILKTNQQQLIIIKSLAASKRALDIANKRYREGYADFQRVLDAQRAMFAQADNQLLNKGNYYSSIIDLYQSMGGGWTSVPVDQLIPEKMRETMQQRTDWGELLTEPLFLPNNNTIPH